MFIPSLEKTREGIPTREDVPFAGDRVSEGKEERRGAEENPLPGGGQNH